MSTTQDYLESAQSSINDALILLDRKEKLDVPGKLRDAAGELDVAADDFRKKLEQAANLSKAT